MDYNRTAARIAKKLAQYGQEVTLTRTTAKVGYYNPDTLQVEGGGTEVVNETRNALVTDQPGTRIGPQYGTNLKKGTLIENAEKWLYMDAKGMAPIATDSVKVGEDIFKVLDVQVTGPGGIPLFYLVVLKR